MLKNIEHVCKTLCKLLEDIHSQGRTHFFISILFMQ